MVIPYIVFFILCCVALYYAGNWVVEALSNLAKILRWKEFVTAFFIMALAATLPNLFLAIASVANHVPELSLGDVMGGNVFDMTLAIALAVFFSKKGIDTSGETVQTSLLYTLGAAILPLVLLLDGGLSRIDGAVLLIFFGGYVYWVLSKKERFRFIYSDHPVKRDSLSVAKDIFKIIAGSAVLLSVGQAIVVLARGFSNEFDVSLSLVGILLVGFGNSLPETFFSIAAAKAGKTKMILGDIMGAVILPGTLVLGLVSLISPFSINGASMFMVARYFLLAASAVFFICVKTGQKITKKEGVLLSAVYIAFLMVEVFAK